MTNAQTYHIPVLRTESIDGLNIRPNGVYADVTFGGGGHSQEIVRRLGEGGRLFGFDQDSDAMNNLLYGSTVSRRYCPKNKQNKQPK